jgi:hypothetical protein
MARGEEAAAEKAYLRAHACDPFDPGPPLELG